MRKTFVYIISILTVLPAATVNSQDNPGIPDTVDFQLKIRAALEVTGPVIYFYDKDTKNIEGHLSMDLNEKTALYFGAGFSDYRYSQYNYSFLSNGLFFKAGTDFNLMNPKKSAGKYWAGVGVHYGLSFFSTEVPSFEHSNYWGDISSSVGKKKSTGHFVELAPGFRAEIFKYLTIGWSVTLKKLIYTGTGKDLRPVYLPGYGNAARSVSTGINYYLIFTIPAKKIRVLIYPEPVEETEGQ